tara:strand:- start:1006 stop:1143 length:138 start_codon:yes stop_codon:yes gene_type:complete
LCGDGDARKRGGFPERLLADFRDTDVHVMCDAVAQSAHDGALVFE